MHYAEGLASRESDQQVLDLETALSVFSEFVVKAIGLTIDRHQPLPCVSRH